MAIMAVSLHMAIYENATMVGMPWSRETNGQTIVSSMLKIIRSKRQTVQMFSPVRSKFNRLHPIGIYSR